MSWDRFKQLHLPFPSLGLSLDLSRVPFDDGFLGAMEAAMQGAFAEMRALEAGAIAIQPAQPQWPLLQGSPRWS